MPTLFARTEEEIDKGLGFQQFLSHPLPWARGQRNACAGARGSGRSGWHHAVIPSSPTLLPTPGARAAPKPSRGGCHSRQQMCSRLASPPGEVVLPTVLRPRAGVGAVFPREGPLCSPCFVYKDRGSCPSPLNSPTPFRGLGVTNLLLPSLPAFFMGVCRTSSGLGPYFWGLPFPPCQGDLSSPCEWEKAYVLKASGWVNKSCTCWPAVFIVEALIHGGAFFVYPAGWIRGVGGWHARSRARPETRSFCTRIHSFSAEGDKAGGRECLTLGSPKTLSTVPLFSIKHLSLSG